MFNYKLHLIDLLIALSLRHQRSSLKQCPALAFLMCRRTMCWTELLLSSLSMLCRMRPFGRHGHNWLDTYQEKHKTKPAVLENNHFVWSDKIKEVGCPHPPRFVPAQATLSGRWSLESQWMRGFDMAVQAESFVLILAMSELNTHLHELSASAFQ